MAKKQRKPRATLEQKMQKLELQGKQIEAKKNLLKAREALRAIK
jgi:hypothetical protein